MTATAAGERSAHAHDLDTAALDAWLAARLPGYRGPLSWRKFEGGQSNPTYLLSAASGQYVLRSKPAPAAQLLPSAHAVEREFRVMHALRDSGVPVPAMLALCEDEAVLGRAFYVMEHVAGRIEWDPALPGHTPAARCAHYEAIVDTLAGLHRVRPETVGLDDFGRPGNYFARQIARWSRQYQASVTEPIPAMDRLMDWLPGHMPAIAQREDLRSVVHGDFRLDNLIWHPQSPQVLAILDWELCTLGHPLADLSYYAMTWHIVPGVFQGLGGVPLSGTGIPSERTMIERYCDQTGLARAADLLPHWPFFLAYNLFRFAAILQGIAKRVEEGTASSARARESAAAARPLAELGWQHAQAVR